MSKPKVAFYWNSSCGGCEEAVVDLAEGVLPVVVAVDIIFWPVALDFKKSDVEAAAKRVLKGRLSVSSESRYYEKQDVLIDKIIDKAKKK